MLPPSDPDNLADFVDRLIGNSWTMDELMARCAAHWEIPLDAIRTNSEAMERRYVT